MNQATPFLQGRKRELEQLLHTEAQGEWTSAEQSEYQRIQFTLSFYRMLEEVNESTSFTKLVLEENVHPQLLCHAILLTPGGVYLFYLLPLSVQQISVLPASIAWAAESEQGEYHLGQGKQWVRQIQQEKGLVSLPVYEFYIVPGPESNIRYVLQDTLILSEEHVPPLFSNFVFREHPENQESQLKLLHFLTDPSTESVSSMPDSGRADAYPKLPPRQRRRRQKEGGWLSRLLSGK